MCRKKELKVDRRKERKETEGKMKIMRERERRER